MSVMFAAGLSYIFLIDLESPLCLFTESFIMSGCWWGFVLSPGVSCASRSATHVALNDPWGAGMEKCPAGRGPCTGMHGVGQRVGAQCTGRDNHPLTGKRVGGHGRGAGAGTWKLWWEPEEATPSWTESPDWGQALEQGGGVGLGPVQSSGAGPDGRVAHGAAGGCRAQVSRPSTLPPYLSRRRAARDLSAWLLLRPRGKDTYPADCT